jgi:hypothetical protein
MTEFINQKKIQMTRYQFDTEYSTYWVDQFGTTRLFMTPNQHNNIGAMHTTQKGDETIGGEYFLKISNGHISHLGWYDNEYAFSPTNDGFDLLTGDAVAYSFKRPV